MEREIYIAQSTRHPFIVSYYFTLEQADENLFFLEHLPSGNLRQAAKNFFPLSEERIQLMSAEVILAIHFLHLRGIAYRNLKPENVLVDKDGHCRLIDFSLSKRMVVAKEKTKSFIGDVQYQAPEQTEVNKKLGHNKSVDWW